MSCLCIVVSNTYCVVFLFCFSTSCVPYVASFPGLSIFDCPFCVLERLYNDKLRSMVGWGGVWLWRLTQISTIFQLYLGVKLRSHNKQK